jgi:hypothetical protein
MRGGVSDLILHALIACFMTLNIWSHDLQNGGCTEVLESFFKTFQGLFLQVFTVFRASEVAKST